MIALTKHRSKFDDRVLETVDKVLRQIFGDEATLLIYEYLENHYSLKQDEIIEKIDLFAKGLEEFLRSGAYVVEMRILEDIHSSCGLTGREGFERRNKQDFATQMKLLRGMRF